MASFRRMVMRQISPEADHPSTLRRGSEVPLLQLLNHPDFEVLRRVRHLGDKTAQQIMSFRRRQGDLKTVSDLHTKVGLKEVLVKKVLKEYHVSR